MTPTTREDRTAALGTLPERVNIGSFLPAMAERRPDQAAVIDHTKKGGGKSITYAALEERAGAIARGLASRGVEPGARVCLFVRPSIDLIAVVYALFKLGAVPVIADPGMGRERLLACIQKVRPSVFIGIPRAHAARRLFPRAFTSVKLAVTVGPRLFWGGTTLERLARSGSGPVPCVNTAASDPAAILFTSGSTGPPKGVLYTHGMFDAQVRALANLYRFRPGEVDLACFPLFALFNTALAMTSVFPEIDVSRPGTCDPATIVDAIEKSGATTTFGSPAIWRRVVPWCIENGRKLESLERVLIAGAPVPAALIWEFHAVLKMDADVHTPYGATEALPVASIAGRDVVPTLLDRIRAGAGTCVGEPAPGIDMRLIRITDDAIPEWSDELEVDLGQPGEVCVRGPVVTHEYTDEPDQTARAKIRSPEGIWHRMGDVGRFDDDGQLWFLGRKTHRIQTRMGLRMPVPTENVFNEHPRVHRTALVGIGKPGEEVPALVVEPIPGELPKGEVMTDGFIMQLRSLARKSPVANDIELFLFHPGFPVDVRHNAKIHREELKAWAEGLLL